MLRQAGLVCRTSAAHPPPPHPSLPLPPALPRPGQCRWPGRPWHIQAVPRQHPRGFHTSPRAAILTRPAQPRSPSRRTSLQPRQTRLNGQRGRNQPPPDADADAHDEPPKWKLLSASHRFQAILPGLKWLEKNEGASFADAQDTFRSWDRMFQHLFRRLQGEPAEPLVEAAESPGGALARDMLKLETVEAMRARWLEEPVAHRKLCWPDAMLATMDSHSKRAAQVLEATLEVGVVPFWAVPDVFAWLVAASSKGVPAHLCLAQQDALPALFLHMLETTPPRSFQLQGWIIGSIVSHCDAPTAARMYKALREYRHGLHFNTQFKIASVLAADGRYRLLALEILEDTLANPRLDPNDRRCAALATQIVTLPPGSKQGLVSPVHMQAVGEAFARLIERGYAPNLFTYTAMIRSLTSALQLSTAWKMFDVMLDQGLTPDPYLFLVLLAGAKRASRSDLAARAIKSAPQKVLQDPVICHEILHAVLTFAYEEYKWTKPAAPHSNPGFGPMLRTYSKFFKIEPLQKLIPQDLSLLLEQQGHGDDVYVYTWQHALIPLLNELPALPDDKKMEPGVPTLNMMIASYIRSSPNVEPAWELYTRFIGLLQNRDPLALSLPRGSTVLYDLVIKALIDNAGMVDRAIEIVTSMLQASSPSSSFSSVPFSDIVTAEPSESSQAGPDPSDSQEPTKQEPSVPHPVRPSVYTWSILIYGVIRSRQPLKSLELLRMMQLYGVKPDHATWTTLIAGFAGTRHDDEAGKALRELAEQGFHPNAHTIRAVGRMRRADAVLSSLEQMAEQGELQLEAEINEATSSMPPLDHDETARVVLRREGRRTRKTERLREEIARQNAKGLRMKAWAAAQKARKQRMARFLQSLLPEGSNLAVSSMSIEDIVNKITELSDTEAHKAAISEAPPLLRNIAFVSTTPRAGEVRDKPEPSVLTGEPPEKRQRIKLVSVEGEEGAAPKLPRIWPATGPFVLEEMAAPAPKSSVSALRKQAPAEPETAPEPTPAEPQPAPPTPPTPAFVPETLGVNEYMELFEEYTRLQDEASDGARSSQPPTWLFEPLDPEDDLEDAVSLETVSAEIRASRARRERRERAGQTGAAREQQQQDATTHWLERLAAFGPGAGATTYPPGRNGDIEQAVGKKKERYLGKKAGRNMENKEGGEAEEDEAFRKLYEVSKRDEGVGKGGGLPPAEF